MKISILGAGNWGTTLAIMLSKKTDVCLWTIEKTIQNVKSGRENVKYLPGYNIPQKINITMELKKSIINSNLLVFAIPSKAFRSVARLVANSITSKPIMVSVTKGMEFYNGKIKRMSEIMMEEIKIDADKVCVLSGPSIAREVIKGIPTSCVCAGKNQSTTSIVQKIFNSQTFRVYSSTDIIGVELGGALKNIIAIAGGMCDGLGLGANSKGALLTRGIKEISRLGVWLGADIETFAGLSGMGDLITTAFSKDSRNRWVGEQIGKGHSVDSILSKMNEVAEGIVTTEAVYKIANKCKIQMPITEVVYKIIFKGKSPEDGIKTLMSRDPKPEKI